MPGTEIAGSTSGLARTLSMTPEDGATIAVTNTGIGMTKEQIAYAMTPFGQVQASYARGHEGTGLGLPIAAALTKLHGGEFHIHSEPGKGTTVFFTLPPLRDADDIRLIELNRRRSGRRSA